MDNKIFEEPKKETLKILRKNLLQNPLCQQEYECIHNKAEGEAESKGFPTNLLTNEMEENS